MFAFLAIGLAVPLLSAPMVVSIKSWTTFSSSWIVTVTSIIYLAVYVVAYFLIFIRPIMGSIYSLDEILYFPLEFGLYFPCCCQHGLFAFIFSVAFFITFTIYVAHPVEPEDFFFWVLNL